MKILKTTIEIGDRIKYKHPLTSPFNGMFGTFEGTVTNIIDNSYQITIPLQKYLREKKLEMSVEFSSLEIIEKVPDPNWLKDKMIKAIQIKEADWTGKYIYDYYTEEYFETSGDLYDRYENDEMLEDFPRYCFATKPRIYAIAEIEDQLSTMFWNVEDEMEFSYIVELQAAIEKFNEINKNQMTTYYPDYSKIVILDLPE